MKAFSEFTKKRDFLICIDSDGCAMDTMNVKHFRCFGPCMVEEWNLDANRDEILKRWNEINLYTVTRGINRFKGLAMALCEINEKYTTIEDVDKLREWADTAPELSNGALENIIADEGSSIIFKKALSWSKKVNQAITNLPDDTKVPFPMVKKALEIAHQHADVAIVSSANLDAVLEEWEMHGLIEHVDVIMSQNDGSKAHCIDQLLKKGYYNIKVVMCGDAPGDLDAAEQNGVFFFPILVRQEMESWCEFIDEGLTRLLYDRYRGDYQKNKIIEFYINLGEKKERKNGKS